MSVILLCLPSMVGKFFTLLEEKVNIVIVKKYMLSFNRKYPFRDPEAQKIGKQMSVYTNVCLS